MAIVQTAVLEAVNTAKAGTSVDAAVAAANRAALSKLLPAQQASIERAYQAALAAVAESPARPPASPSVSAPPRASSMRAPTTWRSPRRIARTTAGAYVPAASPAAPHWGLRQPWLMTSAAQFRPAPPPALDSAVWGRDYNEVKRLGAKASAARTPEQTEIAQFWEYSLPPIYHGVVRSVAAMPGRNVAQNAHLFAAAAQAMDDALIAVFDAKYHYNFWHPVTAIRNGDIDGNTATERDAAWTAFHDAPMHPEYPSGHAILAGALGAVLEAELGGTRAALATSSPSAKNVTRHWTSVAEFVQEVSDARIYEGIHFRTAVDIGTAMGRQIGELAGEEIRALALLSARRWGQSPGFFQAGGIHRF
jgi:hypothetical protein